MKNSIRLPVRYTKGYPVCDNKLEMIYSYGHFYFNDPSKAGGVISGNYHVSAKDLLWFSIKNYFRELINVNR